MRYATIEYREDVGAGWDCASPKCKSPATIRINRSDAGYVPARAQVYCGRHAAIIQRNLIGQLFPIGQRVLEYYGTNPHIPASPSAIIPSDYGAIKSAPTHDGYLVVQHAGYTDLELHRIPANTGLWACYE